MNDDAVPRLPGQATTASRNHALDGLRAIAASLVVTFHLGLMNGLVVAVHGGQAFERFMRGLGSSGVELFFTLSAVVLLRPYLMLGRPMPVARYLQRRCSRLWPPYLGAWLLAGAAVALVGAYPTWWPSSMPPFAWRDWCAQVFIVYAGDSSYNFAWWTLTIEVLFYLLAPLLVRGLAARGTGVVVAAFLASVVLAQGAKFLHPAPGVERVLTEFLTFASCFLGGIVLATMPVRGAASVALVAVGACFIAGNAFSRVVDGHIGYGMVYMAIVAQALDRDSAASRLLSRPLLVWLGERSYSLFLTHFSVILLACWATSLVIPGKGAVYFIASRSLAVLGAGAIACLLFEGVESRFAHGLVTVGRWWPWRSVPGRAATGEPAPGVVGNEN